MPNSFTSANPLALPTLATILLAGCAPKAEDLTALAPGIVVGPEFSVSKGLFVPEETRRSLGVQIADVGEGRIPAEIEFTVRIFQSTAHGSRASGALPPAQAALLAAGSPVQIRVDNRAAASGRIAYVGESPAPASSTVEVIVESPEPLERGAFGSARMSSARADPVSTVPRGAIVEAADGPFVYVVSGDHFVRTPVKLGGAAAGAVEITDGLYSGDQVVSEAVMALWLTELAAVKGGQACCILPPKGK